MPRGASNPVVDPVESRSSGPKPSDAELVLRCQRGDARAFDELVARYQDRVYNMVYRMSRNHADALDITQTAFLRTFENLGRFESRSNFYTWLFRIAVNACITNRRRAKHQPILLQSLVSDDEGTPRGFEPAAPLQSGHESDQRVFSARLTDALAQVDPEFRAAVLLKDVENFDYAEIAGILEVPIGTVKSRIFRGRAMLRDLLRDLEDQVP